jgi:hypothetical protein
MTFQRYSSRHATQIVVTLCFEVTAVSYANLSLSSQVTQVRRVTTTPDIQVVHPCGKRDRRGWDLGRSSFTVDRERRLKRATSYISRERIAEAKRVPEAECANEASRCNLVQFST